MKYFFSKSKQTESFRFLCKSWTKFVLLLKNSYYNSHFSNHFNDLSLVVAENVDTSVLYTATLFLHSGFKSWEVFKLFCIFVFQSNTFFPTFMLSNFLVRTPWYFLPTKRWKTTLKKAAQTAQTEEFMFQNVAYRPTVYKTGVDANDKLI